MRTFRIDQRMRFGIRKKGIIALFALICLFSVSLHAVHGDAPQRTKDSKTLIVKGDNNSPPFEYLHNGQPTGFNIELIRAVADAAGLNISIELRPLNEAREDMEKGKADILTGIAYSPEQNNLYSLSVPHSIQSFDLFVRTDSAIKSLEGARGKEIMVQEGSAMHDFLKEKELTSDIIAVKDASGIAKTLAAGQHDAALLSKVQGLYFINTVGLNNIKALGVKITPRKYSFAVRKGDDVLLAQLNDGLNILKSSGKFDDLREKWFGIHEKKSIWESNANYLLYGLCCAIVVLIVCILWILGLRKGLRRRTTQLVRSRDLYRLLVENAPEGVIVLVENKPVLVNSRAVRITGFFPEELTAKTLAEIVYPQDRGPVVEAHRKIVTGEAKNLELSFRITDKEGTTKWIISNAVHVDWDGIPGILSIFADISGQKKLEEQYLQAQKMEAIGQLAGGIAHDFNNILTAIIGYGNLLKLKAAGDTVLKRYADNILGCSDRAANLIKGLLAFSKKQVHDPKPTDLHDMIGGAEKMLRRIIGEDIEFSLIFSKTSLVVNADSGQFIQVLMNLATNARDAMPKGGKLTIRTQPVEIDDATMEMGGLTGSRNYALVTFEDTGVGMDESTVENIFDPTFTTKDAGKGSGLGLATVYGIIKQQKGVVTVHSNPGSGTTFNIYLPLVDSPLRADEKIRPYPLLRGTETILLCEDEPDIRKFIREVLESNGYSVIEARDGEEAIEAFRYHREKISLVILDVIMPKKSGKDVHDMILEINPFIKTIFMSGYTSDILQKEGLTESTARCIFKPIEINNLLTEVRRTLDGM